MTITTNTGYKNSILATMTYPGKSKALNGMDKMLRPANAVFANGKKITVYKNSGDQDFSAYSVQTAKNAKAKDVILVVVMCMSLIYPILLLLKATNRDYKKITKLMPNLRQIPAPGSMQGSYRSHSSMHSFHKLNTKENTQNSGIASARNSQNLDNPSNDPRKTLNLSQLSDEAADSPSLWRRIFGGNNAPTLNPKDFTPLPADPVL